MSNGLLYSEKELLQRIAEGDEQAFAAVFHHYRDAIYKTAYRLTDSAGTAEDVLQEVFMIIWLHRASLHNIENFPAYLLTIARNHIIRAFKKAGRQQDAVDELSGIRQLYHADTDHALREREYNRILQQAVAQLPPRQAEVYRLVKETGLTREQAAQQLRLSPETVKTHMELATRKVRAFCLASINLSLLWMVMARLG